MFRTALRLERLASYRRALMPIAQLWATSRFFVRWCTQSSQRHRCSCSCGQKVEDEGIRFSLAILGNGPLRPELERLITSYELLTKLFPWNYITRNLGKWYQWADVTCVPSTDEPLGMVVLVSLVAGTPVIGSAVGGIPFMLQAEVNELLVPPGNPEALASALARIADSRLSFQLKSIAAVRFSAFSSAQCET